MPNKDGTGPRGEGSKTGRQLGNCAGAQDQGQNQERGRGLGRRCGRGQGNGRCGQPRGQGRGNWSKAGYSEPEKNKEQE
ncbi:DUF5320 domain-containing protein [Candidatus Woesearchaeota archaeon]|nr:DUF5320 domain-containing protein [Candidatus Woesearchaeota archaeon]